MNVAAVVRGIASLSWIAVLLVIGRAGGVVISAVAPLGYRETALQPGLQWIVPFAETVATYSIARQTYTMSIAPLEGSVAGDDSVAARTADGREGVIAPPVLYS